jgi:hypothetical protein
MMEKLRAPNPNENPVLIDYLRGKAADSAQRRMLLNKAT